jgi:hypothetical protein
VLLTSKFAKQFKLPYSLSDSDKKIRKLLVFHGNVRLLEELPVTDKMEWFK